jgi:hypothetical protein
LSRRLIDKRIDGRSQHISLLFFKDCSSQLIIRKIAGMITFSLQIVARNCWVIRGLKHFSSATQKLMTWFFLAARGDQFVSKRRNVQQHGHPKAVQRKMLQLFELGARSSGVQQSDSMQMMSQLWAHIPVMPLFTTKNIIVENPFRLPKKSFRLVRSHRV